MKNVHDKQKPTIVDIARNLEISPSSVSKALRNKGRIGTDLKKQIFEEAARLGYKPNFAARALRTQSSQLIGLIVPNFFSFQIDELVTNIQKYAQSEDYGIVLGLTNFDPELELAQLEFMASKRVEGIIIKSRGSHQTLDRIYKLSQEGIKFVSLLDKVDIPNVSSVVVDNRIGGELATTHLLEKKHDKILYVTYESVKSSLGNPDRYSRERYFGLLNAYSKLNKERPSELVIHLPGNAENNASEEAFTEFLATNHNNFSAIFAYDDQIAAGVVRAMNRSGYRVPEDFSVVGFDDSMLVNKWSKPRITVIKQPDEQVGFEAVNILIGSKDKSKAHIEGSNYIVTPTLIERESVAINSNKSTRTNS